MTKLELVNLAIEQTRAVRKTLDEIAINSKFGEHDGKIAEAMKYVDYARYRLARVGDELESK